MNFKELHEGAEPNMPGAPSGIKIMTPQQFVASAGDSKSDEEVSEGGNAFMPGIQNTAEYKAGFATGKLPVPYPEGTQQYASYYKGVIDKATPNLNKGTAGNSLTEFSPNGDGDYGDDPGEEDDGLDIDENHLSRIRKLSGLDEATKLPAQTRDLDSQEFQDYMKRIVGTPDLDKEGNVKVDKKGNEKYTTGKTKGDKYKMPYIHRSSVVTYLSPDGKTYDEDAVK